MGEALAHDKAEVHFNTAVDDAYPDGKGALDGLHTKDAKTSLTLALCSHSNSTSTPSVGGDLCVYQTLYVVHRTLNNIKQSGSANTTPSCTKAFPGLHATPVKLELQTYTHAVRCPCCADCF